MEVRNKEDKGILGIRNRTENWKTARYFAPFFKHGSISIVERLLGNPPQCKPDEVNLELYWTGMRDYIHRMEKKGAPLGKSEFTERYRCLFRDLREGVKKFGGFTKLKDHNYRVSDKKQEDSLYDNLRHTEIDVVLETPHHLFIGEAKHEMSFGANANLILVHQLIRQYVMAKILVDIVRSEINGPKKEVIPFLVVDRCNLESVKNTAQVKFMLEQHKAGREPGLKEENVLSWDDIKKLHP